MAILRRKTVELSPEQVASAAPEQGAGMPGPEGVSPAEYEAEPIQGATTEEEIRRRALAYLAEDEETLEEWVAEAEAVEPMVEPKYYTGHALYQEEIEEEARRFLEEELTPVGEEAEERGPIHPAQRRRSDTVQMSAVGNRPKKKRKKKHWLARILVTLVLVGGLVGLAMSPIFAIKKITVEGNVNYTQEQVIEISGLKKGQNMFRMHKGDVRDRMLENSYMESVQIHRKLPGTIAIVIEERQELAAVPVDKTFAIIDREGYVLRIADEPGQLTQVTGVTVTEAEEGSHLEAKEEDVLAETLSLLSAMQYSDLFFKKVQVTDQLIVANVYDSLLCKGTPEAVLENIKNGNLEKILYDLTQKKITKGTIYVQKGQYCSFSPQI